MTLLILPHECNAQFLRVVLRDCKVIIREMCVLHDLSVLITPVKWENFHDGIMKGLQLGHKRHWGVAEKAD